MVYPKRIEWQGGTTAHGRRRVSGPQGGAQTSWKPRFHQNWHDRRRASWLSQTR